MDEKERHERGMARRRKVLGNAWVDRANAKKTPFNAEFQDFITRALSSAAKSAQASSMSAGREYSNGAAFMDALRGSQHGWLRPAGTGLPYR